MIQLNHIMQKTPEVISKVVEKEIIVILPDLGEVKVLNEVGARIWELIDGKRPLSDLVDIICEEYLVARDVAEQDALEFAQRMIDSQLVSIMG
jgi:hypothetical protein